MLILTVRHPAFLLHADTFVIVSLLPQLVSYQTTQDQLQLRVSLRLLITYVKSTSIFR